MKYVSGRIYLPHTILPLTYFIHLPMKMEPIVSSETSAIRTQTPGNYPRRNKLHTEYGESLKTRTNLHVSTLQGHHQAYKITILTKTHPVILPTGSRGLQFQCSPPHRQPQLKPKTKPRPSKLKVHSNCKPRDPIGNITACALVNTVIL